MSATSLRVAGAAAFLSAVTTFLLWLLPRLYDAPAGFEQAILMHQDTAYIARLWVNFVHIFLCLAAYGAAAVLLWKRSPALAGFGFVCFLLWGFTELIGVSINLFAVNFTWRAQFQSATPEVQEQLRVLLTWFPAMWDALFFVLVNGFLAATTCYGLAALPGKGLERWSGALFLLGTPLTLGIIVGNYTSLTIFSDIMDWIYPVLQPVSRATLAAWLWHAGSSRGGG